MASLTTGKLEEFINDVLKEELKAIASRMNFYNTEIRDYVELRNTIETLQANFPEGNFKTNMAIGHNMYMQAKVPDFKHIMVDIGLGYWLNFTPEEALNFCSFKIKTLTKDVDRLRELSVDKRMEIKMALMVIADKEQLYEERKD